MKTEVQKSVVLCLVSALVGFGLGWLVFHGQGPAQQLPAPEPVIQDVPVSDNEPEPAPPADSEGEKVVETGETFAPDVRPAVKDRTDPMYLAALARVELSHGAWTRAEQTIRKAIEATEDPDTLKRLRLSLSDIYEKQGRWDEVLKTREAELAVTEDDQQKQDLSLAIAKAHVKLGRIDEAEKALTSLEKTTKNLWRKHQNSSQILQ